MPGRVATFVHLVIDCIVHLPDELLRAVDAGRHPHPLLV